MTLPSLTVAKAYAEHYGKHIYVRIDGDDSIWEIFPGGRIIKHSDTERFRKRLTSDSEFAGKDLE